MGDTKLGTKKSSQHLGSYQNIKSFLVNVTWVIYSRGEKMGKNTDFMYCKLI